MRVCLMRWVSLGSKTPDLGSGFSLILPIAETWFVIELQNLHKWVLCYVCISSTPSGTPLLHLDLNMTSDLSALLNSSRALNSHLSRPDLPSVNLSLDQIEAQSRRLVTRQPAAAGDTDRACVSLSL